MISKVQVKSGFATKLPSIANGRIFEFNNKFNVLFGSNGVGKSVLIKIMAAYSGIQTGGWSQINDPSKLGYNSVKHFPFCYRNYSPGQCDAYVEYDGMPTFYNDVEMTSKNDTTWFFSNANQSNDGITSEAEQLDVLATKPSSGQYRIHKINKIMQVIQNPPNLTEIPSHIKNKDLALHEVNYRLSLPRNGKITILLDEPEKALALPKQLELFNTLNTLSEYFQVIIATHSPFILFFKGANIIDMEEGYAAQCRELIKEQVKRK